MAMVETSVPAHAAPDETAHRRAARARARLARRWWRREIVGSVDYANVVARVDAEAGLSPRYLFMVVMSAGIAVLGLLLSSPAVIIGAMLISPLMGPIIGLGFALAIFEWREVRRSLSALALGSALAVLFCAMIVALSPLQSVTPEILARTRPNLFDLLVAVFSALAGTYATIRGRGETIVGVAIATALMPPLAVVGFGLATTNLAVFAGAFGLFMTNLLAIALSAAIMARFYGFGTELSPQQTRAQAGLIIAVFVVMSVPLALALRHIAWEAIATRQARSEISQHFGPGARVSQLEMDFAARPLRASAVVMTDRFKPGAEAAIAEELLTALGRPADVRLNQVVVDQDFSRFEQERAALEQSMAADAETVGLARALAAATGARVEDIAVDRSRRIAMAIVSPGADVDFASLRAAEARLAAANPRWDVRIVPPAGFLPAVAFPAGVADLDPAGLAAVEDIGWALRRWQASNVQVIGRVASSADGPAGGAADLAQRRAEAVLSRLGGAGVTGTTTTDLPGPLQRAAEREDGLAQFRSVEVRVAPAPPVALAPVIVPAITEQPG